MITKFMIKALAVMGAGFIVIFGWDSIKAWHNVYHYDDTEE